MTEFTKIDAIRKHLRLEPVPTRATSQSAISEEGGKRVQKNLSILEIDAARLAELAKRDGVSQARLLSAALDAYERGKR